MEHETEVQEPTFMQKATKVILDRLLRIIVSFSIVTVLFLVMEYPFWLTATAATSGTLAWVLASMFLSISSCLLSK